MTVQEALIAVVQLQVSDLTLQKALTDAGLADSDVYSKSTHAKGVDLAAIDVLEGIITGAITEGGYSLSINRAAVESRLLNLKTKHGLIQTEQTTQPKLKSLTRRW